MRKEFISTLFLITVLASTARADWFSDSWPSVRQRIEELTPESMRKSMMTIDCSPSDELAAPSVELADGVSLTLTYPNEQYAKTCFPTEDPRYAVFHRNGEMLIYSLYSSVSPQQTVLKEWIYTEHPNTGAGSRYAWDVQGAEKIEANADGGATMQAQGRSYVIDRIKYWTAQEINDRPIEVSHETNLEVLSNDRLCEEAHVQSNADEVISNRNKIASAVCGSFAMTEGQAGAMTPNAQISFNILAMAANYPMLIDPTINYGQWIGADTGGAPTVITTMVYEPITAEVYIGGFTISAEPFSEAITMYGSFGDNTEGFVIEIADGGTPSLVWGQWLGGDGADEVNALILSEDDEIYAAGYSAQSTGFETVTFQGVHSGSSEGFVIEIDDGGTPSLVWGQWIGGLAADEVSALALTDDEIYAAGYSLQSTSFETITPFQGVHSGGTEGFVIEIADGGTPSLVWGQWLGGLAADEVKALALTDDEIYAGGYSTQSTSFEAVTFQGANSGGSEGFVIEIADGGTPSLVWGQWIGGGLADEVNALTLLDDEIYAGGYSTQSTSFEAVTFQGAQGGGSEGFVIEIADGGTPSLVWGQWLGGTANDVIYALTLTGDEIYAGGSSTDSASFETVSFAGVHSGGTEGFFVEIADGGTPSLSFAQWVGGTGDDLVYAMQVSGDQIYAAGYSTVSTSFENLSFQGVHNGGSEGFVVAVSDGLAPVFDWGQWVGASGGGAVTVRAMAIENATDEIYSAGFASPEGKWSETPATYGTYGGDSEGFVVEIADGGTPALNWLQWIGGRQIEQVLAIAVTGDEIYVGGYSNQSTGFETVTFAGAFSGSSEAFVIEIADGGSPSLIWGQWLGGTGIDTVNVLAVNGDEIYAGGVSDTSTSFESAASNQGALIASEGFVIEIADGGTPSLVWRQWLGGTSLDTVYALAVTDDEIYAGGYSDRSTTFEAVTFQGVLSGATEGFVIEIADGGTPSLVWGQWLGGGLNDTVFALAVTDDEIYAGGYSAQSTSFEAVLTGVHSGSNEGFVFEIADGGTPALAWGQWIGGTGTDVIWALALSGDEIYAGGYSSISTSFEAVTFQGANNGASEGFVVEIADGGTPSLVWGQWLGALGNDTVYALALTGDEIYAGGYSAQSTSFETVTFAGAHDGASEGFVVEIGDGGTPTLAWGQWMGGGQTPITVINAMVLNDTSEIYAGGYATTSTSFETVTFAGSFTRDTEAFVVEIAAGGTPSLSWGHWLGGEAVDVISAIAVTGDEIYVGGYSTQSTGFEAVLTGVHSGNFEGFVVEFADGGTPSLVWGQWLGGANVDWVLALALTDDEIYAGGYSAQSTSFEAAAVNTGVHSGSNEGFVIEIADGGTPSLAWRQWLGGTGSDAVFAVAVTDDEIYAGGYSGSSAAGFSEAVTFQGTHNSSVAISEGFVIEIADGGTPSLIWGQYLGGTSADHIYALAVIGDEIYAGGYATLSTSFEAVTFAGTFSGGLEGFVVEIADGGTPSLVWAQWLGGNGNENVFSIALEGANVYAGGYSSQSTLFEAGDFIKGAHSGAEEGFVAQLTDGVAPQFSSLTWFGGTSNDRVFAVQAATGVVYAAGYATLSTSFETFTFAGTHGSVTEGFVAEVAIPTIALSWGQFVGAGPLVSNDRISAIAVTGDEIYVGGLADRSTSFEAVTFAGAHVETEGFVIEIADGGTPSLVWGQWLGGTLVDEVTALALTGDEIYAAGYSTRSTSFETITPFQGVHSGGSEGFIVEIADGGTPSLVWGQWFGGNIADVITALQVTDDEIYAAGYSTSTAVGQFEAVTFQGSYLTSIAVNEGFVIEIADGGTPSLVWGQWIGGDSNDQALALGLAGDEVYVGGYSVLSTGFETVTFSGANNGSSEGYVIEIADGGTPSLVWGQWLGGVSDDVVFALAVTSDEIYAGGYSAQSTAFEAVTFQGLQSGSSEGFVIEIADGGTPSLTWGQWIGGTGVDVVTSLAVVNSEIYAGGYSTISTSFESVLTGTHSGGTEGFVAEIKDGAVPTINWGQWYGGTSSDQIMAIAVTGDEIYAGGFSTQSTSFEAITFAGAHSGGTEAFIVEIADDVAATGTTDVIFYDQMF